MVIIFVGTPGSGKSTIAKLLYKKLNRLGQSRLLISDEISGKIYKRIENFLRENLNKFDYIIVDATFYKRKWQKMVQKICGKDNLIMLDIHCPLKVCLQRNKQKSKPLPEKVLHIIHHQIERPKTADLIVNTEKIRPKEAVQTILLKIIQKQYFTKQGLSLFLKKFGLLYSKELDINLASKKPSELFKWFLASLLFGARISETIAKNTYRAFERHNILTPQKILKTGWRRLIKLMGEGGYVRYDGKTSNELLRVSKALIEKYNGDLNNVEKMAKDSKDLEEKLQEFYSVGPVTCNIFLRELRGIWQKADPQPGKLVKIVAERLRIRDIKKYWSKHKVSAYDFRHFEVALLRLSKVLK